MAAFTFTWPLGRNKSRLFQQFSRLTLFRLQHYKQKYSQKLSNEVQSGKDAHKTGKTDQVLHKMKSRKLNRPETTGRPEKLAQNTAEERKEPSLEEFLEEKGVCVKNVKAQLDLSKLSVDRIKKTMKLLGEFGITRKEEGKILSRRPRILTTKGDILRKRFQIMRDIGINPDSVVYVITQSPGVLTAKIEESLPEKVKFFEDMDVRPKFTTGEILHVLTKCPDIIATCSVKSLDEKTKFFEKDLKFNKHHIKNVIFKQPSVLTFSQDAMLEKYKYCYDKINVSPSSIARCPRVFQCSLKRIQERHQFLKHLGRIRDEMTIDDYGLGLIVTTSDKQFIEKVARSSMEEFDHFRKYNH